MPSSGGHWGISVKLWVDSTTRQYTRLSICPTKPTQLLLFMLRREWKDLQTEDWKPGMKQAGRWRKENAEDTSQSPCLYYLYCTVLSHFPSKIYEQEILDFRSVTRHKGAVVHMHATKDDNATKHPTLSQKVNTALRHFNTSAFWRLLSFATRSVFWKFGIQIAKTLCQKHHKSKYSFLNLFVPYTQHTYLSFGAEITAFQSKFHHTLAKPMATKHMPWLKAFVIRSNDEIVPNKRPKLKYIQVSSSIFWFSHSCL
jgi:hypothetical protein